MEGYQRLELAAEAMEGMRYLKKSEIRQASEATAENLRQSLAVMDQTDDDQELILTLARLIEEKRVFVRVYTKGRLHAKAYIFDYGPIYDAQGKKLPKEEKGVAIVGSSNLSLAALTHNTELNVIVYGNDNHTALSRWFEELWEEAQDFEEILMRELKESWAAAAVRPYDIYMKVLYELVKDRLEGEEAYEILWEDEITERLADFQKTAVRQATRMIRRYGGCFVSDVVGLGKSYIGAAIIKHFMRLENARPLIICPAALTDMWERYNDVYHLNAIVLSQSLLKEGDNGYGNFLLEDERYQDRDFVLVDESHNFRHQDTQRYRVLQEFLMNGRRCCFLTATPRNKSAWDVYHQFKLFHPDDKTSLPIDPPHLREYFKRIEQGVGKLPALLSHILIRRTRKHILRWYGFDAETHQPVNPDRFSEYLEGKRNAYVIVGGRHQYFPQRQLQTITYSIEATYQGLYGQIRKYLGKPWETPQSAPSGELTYARYGLWHYVKPEKQRKIPYIELQQAGSNLRGLMRVLLFKRFESSVYAFCETVCRFLKIHELFVQSLDKGIIPAGDEAQAILYESDMLSEVELFDALRKATHKYAISDFNVPLLKEHVAQDIRLLKEILKLVEPITPAKDAKLQELVRLMSEPLLAQGKCLIFTQYADTARYLFENLNPDGKRENVEVIYSGDKNKSSIVGRFAPKSNPESKVKEPEINLLIATDVLAEGLNLQDCDKIINYDLHWNPVRLIQRFGRIDRIGSEYERIYAFNFLPETELEKNLGLQEKLQNRINEIHTTIGEDAAILDPSERINEEAMYAIYERKGGNLEHYGETDAFMDLTEAEEMFRQMSSEKPEEFERIRNLRDGIRTARTTREKGFFVMRAAGRYRKLYLVDQEGKEITTDISRILENLKCEPDLPASPLPQGYNSVVMRVKRRFAEEARHRQTQIAHGLSLSLAQQYVLRELRVLFAAVKDDELRSQVNILEHAFRAPLNAAVRRELNLLRRNGATGGALLRCLIDIYHQHNLSRMLEAKSPSPKDPGVSRIICSEGFV